MDAGKLVPIGIALGIAYAIAKFSPNAMVKAAAYGTAGVIVARQIPYLREALSA